jgi:threonine dehydrogenase-like Zn-dependent dehydrogenase
MKAIAVIPGKPNSIHIREVPKPTLNDIPDGRGVLVKVLQVGLDGTDRKIIASGYGSAPSGDDFLILGHESIGQVEAVGPNVTELKPGAYVVATVRRPGSSLYDRLGMYDMTTDETYFERGINLLHGFLTEYYVDEPEYLVEVPEPLKHIGLLIEATSINVKAIAQAYEIQRRLRLWQPRSAAVLGTGPIGLLITLLLRLRGIRVVATGLSHPASLNAQLVEAIGARYINAQDLTLKKISEKQGPFDLILEATGYSPLVFEAMEVLAKNGVLVMLSITGGNLTPEVPTDRIVLDFVLGNKVAVGSVNSNREHFEMGVKELSLAELKYPGWLSQMLTHPVRGLENYEEMTGLLQQAKEAIKVFCEVKPF